MDIAYLSARVTIPFLAILVVLATNFVAAQDTEVPATRINSGLILLYDFSRFNGNTIDDVSGINPLVQLKIETPKSLERSKHQIELKNKSLARSFKIAPRIAAAVIRSGELTLEAWIRPDSLEQTGPARIFTYSRNSNDRNFTIGQDGTKFEFRVRSTKTTNNGIPSLASKPDAVKTELTHLVYTRDRTGRTRIYINGELNVEQLLAGDLTNWTADFHIAVGNEMTKDRPWNGKINLLAIYQRDLLPHEIEQNFRAGPEAKTKPLGNASASAPDFFVSKVAPIIGQHCLECHDASTKEGGLDLSTQKAAFAGGDSGQTILSKRPYESSFWTMVVANEMPKERETLSSKEKQILKQWIDGGAKWSGGPVDPATLDQETRQAGQSIWVRRLTVSEFIATVHAATGVDISKEAHELLPPDLRADGFKNTAYNLNVDLKHIGSYARLAELIVEKINIGEFASRFTSSDDDSEENDRTLISGMGKWLFRGPLEDHEYEPFLRVAQTVRSAGGDFHESTAFILEAMLQSPRFIYQVENQRGDGTIWPVGEYELASRLSYILWGAPPDKELIAAVDRGEFYDRSGVKKQVERMLNDPRVVARSVEFLDQWLDLDRLAHMQPNAEKFPNWDPELASDMKKETTEFFIEVVWRQNRPLIDILNAQITFASPRLAKHYNLKSNVALSPKPTRRSDADETQNRQLRRFDLESDSSRGGLLTQGSVLTIGGDEASMVTRGLFVLQDLLRGSVKDPPPGVDTRPIPTKAGLTQRKISESRIADASCGGCHRKFEPLAFGLERFDGLGAYHENDDHGNRLRDDGEILFPGNAKPTPYANSAELMDLLAQSDRVKASLTWKVTQFAIGRPLTSADSPTIEKIHAQSQQNGGTYKSLLSAIVLSDLVQATATEKSKK